MYNYLNFTRLIMSEYAIKEETDNIKDINTKVEDQIGENLNDYQDIVLLFPESISSESLQKEFILSKNDARQSNFLSVLIDNVSKEDNSSMHNNLIKIPESLYLGVRYIDLCYFIDLWKGKEILYDQTIINNFKINFKSLLKLSDSLGLDENLAFVKQIRKASIKK